MSNRMVEEFREAYRRKALGADDPVVQSLDALEGPFVVEENGKKLFDGFIAYFHATYRTMRLIDPSLPPGLPQHLLDPVFIAKCFGFSVEEFATIPSEDQSVTREGIKRMEAKLDKYIALSKRRVPLNPFEERIVAIVATKALKGSTIATRLGIDYGTKLKAALSALYKQGVLKKIEGGYISAES